MKQQQQSNEPRDLIQGQTKFVFVVWKSSTSWKIVRYIKVDLPEKNKFIFQQRLFSLLVADFGYTYWEVL